MSLPKNPSTLNSPLGSKRRLPEQEPSTFIFPPSVQADLFNYLKPDQQKILKPILRLVKRPYQAILCTSLVDYLEGNGLDQLDEPILNQMQKSIIEVCELHPLTSHEPQHISEVIKQTFPSFKGKV